MASNEHVNVLLQGVENWNAWRQQNPGIKPNLAGAALHGMDLARANLRDAILQGADLTDANLYRAQLDGAALEKANLSRANLNEASLVAANLAEANLTRAYLRGSNLQGALMKDSSLPWANLFRANLSQAELFKADLREAVLYEASLNRANLTKANLSGANLRSARLEQANFSRAYLRQANLHQADARGAIFTKANLYNVDFSAVNLTGANLFETVLSRADLTESILEDVNLSRANLNDANLTRAVLRRANLDSANFSGCRLQETAIGELLREDTLETGMEVYLSDELIITVDDFLTAGYLEQVADKIDKNPESILMASQVRVLLLGDFADQPGALLNMILQESRRRKLLPVVVRRDKPGSLQSWNVVVKLLSVCRLCIAALPEASEIMERLSVGAGGADCPIKVLPLSQTSANASQNGEAELSELDSEHFLPTLHFEQPEELNEELAAQLDQLITENQLVVASPLELIEEEEEPQEEATSAEAPQNEEMNPPLGASHRENGDAVAESAEPSAVPAAGPPAALTDEPLEDANSGVKNGSRADAGSPAENGSTETGNAGSRDHAGIDKESEAGAAEEPLLPVEHVHDEAGEAVLDAGEIGGSVSSLPADVEADEPEVEDSQPAVSQPQEELPDVQELPELDDFPEEDLTGSRDAQTLAELDELAAAVEVESGEERAAESGSEKQRAGDAANDELPAVTKSVLETAASAGDGDDGTQLGETESGLQEDSPAGQAPGDLPETVAEIPAELKPEPQVEPLEENAGEIFPDEPAEMPDAIVENLAAVDPPDDLNPGDTPQPAAHGEENAAGGESSSEGGAEKAEGGKENEDEDDEEDDDSTSGKDEAPPPAVVIIEDEDETEEEEAEVGADGLPVDEFSRGPSRGLVKFLAFLIVIISAGVFYFLWGYVQRNVVVIVPQEGRSYVFLDGEPLALSQQSDRGQEFRAEKRWIGHSDLRVYTTQPQDLNPGEAVRYRLFQQKIRISPGESDFELTAAFDTLYTIRKIAEGIDPNLNASGSHIIYTRTLEDWPGKKWHKELRLFDLTSGEDRAIPVRGAYFAYWEWERAYLSSDAGTAYVVASRDAFATAYPFVINTGNGQLQRLTAAINPAGFLPVESGDLLINAPEIIDYSGKVAGNLGGEPYLKQVFSAGPQAVAYFQLVNPGRGGNGAWDCIFYDLQRAEGRTLFTIMGNKPPFVAVAADGRRAVLCEYAGLSREFLSTIRLWEDGRFIDLTPHLVDGERELQGKKQYHKTVVSADSTAHKIVYEYEGAVYLIEIPQQTSMDDLLAAAVPQK